MSLSLWKMVRRNDGKPTIAPCILRKPAQSAINANLFYWRLNPQKRHGFKSPSCNVLWGEFLRFFLLLKQQMLIFIRLLVVLQIPFPIIAMEIVFIFLRHSQAMFGYSNDDAMNLWFFPCFGRMRNNLWLGIRVHVQLWVFWWNLGSSEREESWWKLKELVDRWGIRFKLRGILKKVWIWRILLDLNELQQSKLH
jgi:hypothetical protein